VTEEKFITVDHRFMNVVKYAGLILLAGYIYWSGFAILEIQNKPTLPDGSFIQIESHVQDALAIKYKQDSDGFYTVEMTIKWSERQSAELYARLTEAQYTELQDIGGDFAIRGKPIHLTLQLKGRRWVTVGVGFEIEDGSIQWIGRHIGLTEGS